VSVLAHIFEAAGIATVVLSSVREVAQKVAPPRALHCEFPLGRPLGIPNDVDFQMAITDALSSSPGMRLQRIAGTMTVF